MSDYCNKCGSVHNDNSVCGRRTWAEQLDAAKDGAEFGQTLQRLLTHLEQHTNNDGGQPE